MAATKKITPKTLAGMLEKSPEETLSRVMLDHDIAALMLVADSPYFSFLPEKFRGQETYLTAVAHSAEAFERVPYEERTPELCLAAVRKHSSCLMDVPEHLQTAELARIAAENGNLEDVLEELKTPELCLTAIRAKGNSALGYVPESMMTPELYHDAVRHSYGNLFYVPNSMLTLEMSMEAVRDFKHSAKEVPLRFRKEVYLEAVRRNGWNLEYVPAESVTPEMCLEAVGQIGKGILNWVPEKMRTPKLYEAAQKAVGDLSVLPESMRTPELCLEAVRKKGAQIQYVPDALKTPEICRLAVMDGDGLFSINLSFVPDRFRTPELCMLALENSGFFTVMRYVPHESMTEELLSNAVKKYEDYLDYIPCEKMTDELLGSVWWTSSNMPLLEKFDLTVRTLCRYLLHLHLHNIEEDERGVLREYYPKHRISPKDKNSQNSMFWYLLALCGYKKSVLPGDIDLLPFVRDTVPSEKKPSSRRSE